jgi:hypothetical protein
MGQIEALKIVKLSEMKKYGSWGIWTLASGETGALNQRLRPLAHAQSNLNLNEFTTLLVLRTYFLFFLNILHHLKGCRNKSV